MGTLHVIRFDQNLDGDRTAYAIPRGEHQPGGVYWKMDRQHNVWTSHSSSPAWHVEDGIPKVTRLDPDGAPDIEASGLFLGTEPARPAQVSSR